MIPRAKPERMEATFKINTGDLLSFFVEKRNSARSSGMRVDDHVAPMSSMFNDGWIAARKFIPGGGAEGIMLVGSVELVDILVIGINL